MSPDTWTPPHRACRGCGAAVFFAVNAKTSKSMIFNAHPDPEGLWTLVDGQAEFRSRAPDGVEEDFLRYLPHHATCPKVKQFRQGE